MTESPMVALTCKTELDSKIRMSRLNFSFIYRQEFLPLSFPLSSLAVSLQPCQGGIMGCLSHLSSLRDRQEEDQKVLA